MADPIILTKRKLRSVTLADPYLKTAWAKEHLETLRKELSAFNESKPFNFVSQDDVKNQRLRIDGRLKETPDRISLIAADVFQNLRSALDQLVWCLAALTRMYPRDTQFPILEKPNPRSFRKRTAGVPAEAVAIIKSLQPYVRGNAVKSHLLWRLNEMCNIDKHRRIPMHGTAVDFTWPQSILKVTRFENDGVMNIPLSLKAAVERHVSLNPYPPAKVVFGDAHLGIECDLEGIDAIHDFVADKVIPRFARFFK